VVGTRSRSADLPVKTALIISAITDGQALVKAAVNDREPDVLSSVTIGREEEPGRC
jgi:hypothetical protein